MTARKARHHKHPPGHAGARRRGWLRRSCPTLFNSLVAPLLVGLALHGLKGCDGMTPAPPPRPAARVARTQQAGYHVPRPASRASPAEAGSTVPRLEQP